MKATNYILFAAAAIALAACSNDELPTDDPNAPVEIRLTSGLEVQTRASHNHDIYLHPGEQVHVWVDDAKDIQPDVTVENLYKDRKLTLNDGGAFIGETMYFPQTGNAVNIYAINGNFDADADWSENGFWGESITHKVEQDQKDDGYVKSDLVYVKENNVPRTQGRVGLNFRHMLSKIEVVLVQGSGSPNIAKVEILNTKPEAKFTPSKEADGLTVEASGEATPIEIDADLTDAGTAAKTDNDEGKVLNEAIIVPQTLREGTQFIRVTLADGGELFYSLPEDKTFDPDKKYRYTITANLNRFELDGILTNWGESEEYTGNAK